MKKNRKDIATQTIEFAEAAVKACENKENGKKYEFECPLCGGTAKASKSTYNGHVCAKCEKCDFSFIE